MNNYQLYRTNVKLGGQVAWNLILDDTPDGKLKVSYFDVTPISPYVDYKYGQNTDCLRYSHQENVRELYNQVKGQFYEACINPELKTIYPILGENKITRDPSLETGCSRISYNRYHKQLQYLCPLWLEDFDSSKILKFEISLCSEDEQTVLSTRSLILDANIDDYHDVFVDYMNNYVDSLNEGESIGDDLLNINIVDKLASVTGLDIASGDIVSKDISNLVPNLYDRERPLMETDYMLIDNYHTSEMICKQLFNFNLVFDIADLVSNIVNNMLRGDSFNIKVDVYTGVKSIVEGRERIIWTPLDKKAFDADYSDIKQYKDILTYLDDINYIDFVHKNKLDQDICHWTLRDNEDYIFNLYSGFSTITPYFYKDAPNYWDSDKENSLTWCKHYEVNSIQSMYDMIIKDDFVDTVFNPSKNFVEMSEFDLQDRLGLNTKFLSTFSIEGLDDIRVDEVINQLNIKNLTKYIFLVHTGDGEYDFTAYTQEENNQIINAVEYSSDTRAEYIVIVYSPYDSHFIMFTAKNSEYLISYKYIVNILNYTSDSSDDTEENPLQDINTITTILNNIIQPNIVYIYNSLSTRKVDSPWINTTEISYVKNNYDRVLAIRYDGKIKPKFSDFVDQIWYRIKLMTEREFATDKIWQRTQTQGFLPNYPSVDYYNLEPIYLIESLDENNEIIYEYNTPYQKVDEYKWFEHSVVFNLANVITQKIYSSDIDENYYNNEYLLDSVLQHTYPELYENHKEYLTSVYDTNIDYEYEYDEEGKPILTPDNEFQYIYTIKLTLK